MNTDSSIRPIAARRSNGAVPIGRSTKFGNPYRVSEHVSADVATRLYRMWVWRTEQTALRNAMWHELRGQRLWCPGCKGRNPSTCHGTVIAEVIANGAEKLAARHAA